MKITITKNGLNNMLEMANSIINDNSIVPTLNNILLESKLEDNKLICVFGNENTAVKFEINENIMVEKSGKVLVRAKTLRGIVSKLQNENITLESIDNSIRITNSSFDANINVLNETSYVTHEFSINNPIEFSLDSSVLYEIQKKISHCLLSKNDKTAIINGIYFDNGSEPGVINFVATDSYKVALFKKRLNAPEFKIVVDYDFINFIVQYATSNTVIYFFIENNKLYAKWNGIIANSKLIPGTYPNVYNVFNIDEGQCSEFTINAKNFFSIIDHGIYLVSSEKTPSTTINVNQNYLETIFRSYEIGNSCEKIKVDNFKGSDIKFLVNAKFMSSILKAFENHEIKVFFTSPTKPIIFADNIDKDFLQLVLPMRSY